MKHLMITSVFPVPLNFSMIKLIQHNNFSAADIILVWFSLDYIKCARLQNITRSQFTTVDILPAASTIITKES